MTFQDWGDNSVSVLRSPEQYSEHRLYHVYFLTFSPLKIGSRYVAQAPLPPTPELKRPSCLSFLKEWDYVMWHRMWP